MRNSPILLRTQIDFDALFSDKSESGRAAVVANLCEAIQTPEPGVAGSPNKGMRFSFQGLYEGIERAMQRNPDITEAIGTTTFNNVSRTQVIDEVLQGYAEPERVGRDLVTPSMQAGKPTGTMSRATTTGTIQRVREGKEYPIVSLSDKKVTFAQEKFGGQIPLTIETVMEDQTGTVMDAARGLGRDGAEYEEKSILYTIQDVAGFEGYLPDGTQVALYSATAPESTNQTPANNIVSTNALADWTDIDNAMKPLASKLKENGEPIASPTNIALLAPMALKGTGGYIIKNSKDTRSNKNADAPRELLTLPGGNWYSPFLDAQSATTWYLGDFKRQFTQTFYWPLRTTFIDGQKDSSMALSDIFGAWVVSIYFDVIARDFRFVIKNTAA